MVLSIASVVFTEGNKWRFSGGQHTFSAAIEDRGFTERLNSGAESFRSSDMLRCKVHVNQTLRGDLLHTEYTVTEVEQRIPRVEQLGPPGAGGHPPPLSTTVAISLSPGRKSLRVRVVVRWFYTAVFQRHCRLDPETASPEPPRQLRGWLARGVSARYLSPPRSVARRSCRARLVSVASEPAGIGPNKSVWRTEIGGQTPFQPGGQPLDLGSTMATAPA
jgi:hypothetical protein